jgi:alpha-1,3-rhamnosyl/mannosyltransferase
VSNQLRNPPKGIPLTATIHDFTTLLVPHLHTESNLRSDKYFIEAVLRRAKGLIADSNNTKSDAVRLLGLNPDRIEVIYPGVSERYFEQPPQKPSPFGKPYILYVGTIEPRKNVGLLLDAYSQLAASVREAFELVIVGPSGWKAEDTMARLLAPPHGVRYLKYVPEAELPGIVAGATVMAYPSLYEGFGLPVAEAMACGVPVITSAVSSLPEVAGESALLVDPYSVNELREALETLLSRPDLRSRLGQCGAARARAMFRWSICAERSMTFFRKIISN